MKFFTPNRERRLLTVYPGAAIPNADCVAEVSKSDARSGACARQDATSVDAAADRFAVDWSGSLAQTQYCLLHVVHVMRCMLFV